MNVFFIAYLYQLYVIYQLIPPYLVKRARQTTGLLEFTKWRIATEEKNTDQNDKLVMLLFIFSKLTRQYVQCCQDLPWVMQEDSKLSRSVSDCYMKASICSHVTDAKLIFFFKLHFSDIFLTGIYNFIINKNMSKQNRQKMYSRSTILFRWCTLICC